MPLAATHIILTISLFDYIKNKFWKNKHFGKHVLFVVAVGSLLPDIDIPLNWILKSLGYNLEHGTYTHTLLFAFIFLFLSFIFKIIKKKKYAAYLIILSAGIVFHLLLDYIIGGGAKEGVMWFFPFSDKTYKIHLFFPLPLKSAPEALDAIILLSWIYFKSPKLMEK